MKTVLNATVLGDDNSYIKAFEESKFTNYVSNINEAQAVAISSHQSKTFETLKEILTNTDIKNIICQNGFVSNIDEYRELYPFLKQKQPNILINFTKCFDKAHKKIKKIIKKEKLGKTLQFNIKISDGLFNNSSKVFGLIEHFFGDITNIKANDIDLINGDIFGYFWIETKKAKGVLTNFFDSEFELFEFEILFEKGLIRINETTSNVEIYESNKQKLQLCKTYPYLTDKCYVNSIKSLLKSERELFEKDLKLSYKILKIKENFLKNANTIE